MIHSTHEDTRVWLAEGSARSWQAIVSAPPSGSTSIDRALVILSRYSTCTLVKTRDRDRMSTKGNDKFDTSIDTTVRQHFLDMHGKEVAIIREMERVLGKNKADDIVRKWSEHNAVEEVRKLVQGEKKPIKNFADVSALVRRWVDELNAANMEDVSITEETADKCACTVTQCIYATVFKALNATDLGYLRFCEHDFETTKAIHPKVALKRTKTLMQGNDCCDFVYYWKK